MLVGVFTIANHKRPTCMVSYLLRHIPAYVNPFRYVTSHMRQNIVVLKIERHGTGLKEYNTYGSSR